MAHKTGPIGPRQDEMPAKCRDRWSRMGRRVGRFCRRWAEIGPGIGPQEKAENTVDFSENEPNGPIGPVLGGREGRRVR